MPDSPFVKHVRAYANKHKISYMCAISDASKTYKPKTKPKTKAKPKPKPKPKKQHVKNIRVIIYPIRTGMHAGELTGGANVFWFDMNRTGSGGGGREKYIIYVKSGYKTIPTDAEIIEETKKYFTYDSIVIQHDRGIGESRYQWQMPMLMLNR